MNLVKSQPFYLFILFLGIVLRLIFIEDMQWKFDEKWMFHNATEAAKNLNFSPIGMPSGGGILNPAFGLWIFSALAFAFPTPVSMAFAISFINILAIAGLLFWGIRRFGESDESNDILKTCALISVSPMAILFSKSLWAQNLLPFFSVLYLIAIVNRRSKGGAFFFGLIGAILGQIHMPGFFYAFGVVLFLFILDFKKGNPIMWLPWLLGSLVGSLPLIPWIIYLSKLPTIVSPTDQNNSGTIELKHIFKFRFYTYMLLESLGIHLKYTFNKVFWDFIKLPMNLYLVGIFHIIAGGIGTVAIGKFLWKLIIQKVPSCPRWKNLLLMSWFGGGLALTLIGLKLHPHYIIVAFPFSYLFIIKALNELPEWATKLFIASHLVISLSMIFYIHKNGGIPDGEYGESYSAQTPEERLFRGK